MVHFKKGKKGRKKKDISSCNVTETKQSVSHGPLLGSILGLQLAVTWQHPRNDPRRERASERWERENPGSNSFTAPLSHTHSLSGALCFQMKTRILLLGLQPIMERSQNTHRRVAGSRLRPQSPPPPHVPHQNPHVADAAVQV